VRLKVTRRRPSTLDASATTIDEARSQLEHVDQSCDLILGSMEVLITRILGDINLSFKMQRQITLYFFSNQGC